MRTIGAHGAGELPLLPAFQPHVAHQWTLELVRLPAIPTKEDAPMCWSCDEAPVIARCRSGFPSRGRILVQTYGPRWFRAFIFICRNDVAERVCEQEFWRKKWKLDAGKYEIVSFSQTRQTLKIFKGNCVQRFISKPKITEHTYICWTMKNISGCNSNVLLPCVSNLSVSVPNISVCVHSMLCFFLATRKGKNFKVFT